MPRLEDYSPRTQKRWKANPLIERIIQDVMAQITVKRAPVPTAAKPPLTDSSSDSGSGSGSEVDIFGLFD